MARYDLGLVKGPKGDPAKVCGKTPDAGGNITLAAADVGAATPVWEELLLPANHWARESNTEHSLIVSTPAAKAIMKGYPSIGLKASADADARKLERAAFALIERATTADGQITFWCGMYFPEITIRVLFSGGV